MDSISNSKLAADRIINEIIKQDGKISFPIDPFKLLKNKNVLITFSDFDKLEGLLLYDEKEEPLVSINMNRPVQRQRFTTAHELGHLELHTKMISKNFLCPISNVKNVRKTKI